VSTNLFEDQKAMMHAFGNTTEGFNADQLRLYLKLLVEEFGETMCAALPEQAERIKSYIRGLSYLLEPWQGGEFAPDEIELFDGLQDVMVVTAGAGLSAGFPMQAGWDEVFRSNMAKIDPATGKVRRREDGKVLKPAGWLPPDLNRVLLQHKGVYADTVEVGDD
jgi:predicted HAD superfamily Cof-like phosphohydrolase